MDTRIMRSNIALLCLVGALLQVVAVAAVDHNVGGDFGWNLPPNSTFFSDWARNKTFFVGDKLVFRSNANETHDVTEPPTESDFDGCVNPGIVFRTSAVFSITLDGPGRRRYFICTVGNHCDAGMKFAVDVLAQPGAILPPPPPSSASSVGGGALLLLVLAAALPGFLFTIVP